MLKVKKAQGIGGALVVLVGLVVLLVLGGLWGIGGYNALVNQDSVVEQKAADVESQMKRRADLVPNLVATVKGYASHETEIFSEVAQARSRLLNADVNTDPKEAAEANQAFDSALGRLLAIAENYPNLKADQNFIRLQDELTGTENRINYARLEYNNAVRDYNIKVRSFPTSIVAGITGFERKEPFQATEAERKTPEVQF